MEKEVVLSVKDLKINFSTDHGYVQAVRGVSFDLYKGETLCIVGESGSGKSVTSKAIMGILAANGRIMNGSIMFEGEDLTKVSEDEFHRIRGHKIGMIFQDPLSSLNPIVRIGKQITEAMLINGNRLKKKYNDMVAEELVAYKNAETKYKTEVNASKERVRFLKAEKKKEITKIKNEPSMVRDGKIYTLKLELDGKILLAKENYKNAKVSLEKEKAALGEQKERVEEINARINALSKDYQEEVKGYKEQYAKDAGAVKEEYRESMKGLKARKSVAAAEYDAQINQVKNESENSQKSLKAQYKPLIKEAKDAFNKKSKKAKKEVNEYKRGLRIDHRQKVLSIIETTQKGQKWKQLKAEHKRYVSSKKITKAEAKARALKIMEEVGISNPEKRFRQYPFEFSGGMRQRIVIAIALTANPDILICDEPTTALDVTIQAQILELINRLKAERHISVIFITHDLGVVANMADRVAVMYAGKIVEYGTEEEIFYDPRHPYTWALLSSIPDINSKEKLEAIPGTPPNMIYPPKGDAFALRSKYAMAIDFKKEPPLFKVSDTHYAATWLLDPRAPKVEVPKIVKTRIENSLKAARGGNK